MRLTFLGTRGYIEARSDRHHRHSSLLITYRGHRVMIDAGEDWRGHLEEVGPDAIVVTHAHPDHAWGLKDGAPCPVWAPHIAWDELNSYPIEAGHPIDHRAPIEIGGMTFEAFPVEHSTVAPAVGYRISAADVVVFYAPDVVYISEREAALAGARLYVGDGASVTRSLVRRQGDALVGHAPIQTQLTWCRKESVPEAVFTHCGTQIVAGDEEAAIQKVEELGRDRGVEARLAFDGLEVTYDEAR